MKRRPFQFKTTTLLLLALVISLPLWWYANTRAAIAAENTVLEHLFLGLSGSSWISDHHGQCNAYDPPKARVTRQPSNLLNRFAGRFMPDVFERVVSVELVDGRYNDDTLTVLQDLPTLNRLVLNSSRLTKQGVERFRRNRPDVDLVDPYPEERD